MAQVMIYVFREPRHYKSKAAESFPFMYGSLEELEMQLITKIADPAVYHVTAFNPYGNLVSEIFKSEKTRGKVK